MEDENGDLVGIDMDLIRAIADDQGFEIEIRSLGFDAACTALFGMNAAENAIATVNKATKARFIVCLINFTFLLNYFNEYHYKEQSSFRKDV